MMHTVNSSSRQLEDCVALVTGGGRGLGAAICRTLADSGATVIVADIRAGLAEEQAHALRDLGGQAQACALDIGDAAQVEAALETLLEEHGRIDVLVNNAGVDVTKSIEDLSVAEWDYVLRVNLRAPFLLSRQVFPAMRAQGGGHIVNVSSTAARRAWANAAAYHASKWGFLGFSHALHVEGREHNIKVTALIAGGMRTPFLLDRFPDIDVHTLQAPEHVAETVRFVLTQPGGTVIPEVMVLPMRETSWP